MSKKNIKQLKKDLNLPDYVIDFNADINGTCLVGHLDTNYKQLKKLFGEPEESDGCKVSGEWVFKDRTSKDVFTVYDWKQTDLYDTGYPSVDEFRDSDSNYAFSVGGHNSKKMEAEKFIAWMKTQLDKRF